MKSGIHPKYMECKITCACGNSFETRATVAELKIDICNVCHPFYTGKQKFVDSAGRVQRFRERYGDYRKRRGGGAQATEAAPASEPQESGASKSDDS
ncbi:MAG: 50S ribosomal protein L31 [Planctomycetota bacterium]|nr:50S ribosomal protein L31 [Planctomycetota bacterium]